MTFYLISWLWSATISFCWERICVPIYIFLWHIFFISRTKQNFCDFCFFNAVIFHGHGSNKINCTKKIKNKKLTFFIRFMINATGPDRLFRVDDVIWGNKLIYIFVFLFVFVLCHTNFGSHGRHQFLMTQSSPPVDGDSHTVYFLLQKATKVNMCATILILTKHRTQRDVIIINHHTDMVIFSHMVLLYLLFLVNKIKINIKFI